LLLVDITNIYNTLTQFFLFLI